MVASVDRAEPHDVFLLVESSERPFQRTRASAGVAGPLEGFIALRALNPFGNAPFFKIR
jgi:hypothetical protein